jgi:hypothetical protein
MSSDPHHVFCQPWIESESGWGTRPDGYSIHLTLLDREAYVIDYWSKMPKAVPEEYSRPVGQPYLTEISDMLLKQLQENSRGGLRIYASPLPKPLNGAKSDADSERAPDPA